MAVRSTALLLLLHARENHGGLPRIRRNTTAIRENERFARGKIAAETEVFTKDIVDLVRTLAEQKYVQKFTRSVIFNLLFAKFKLCCTFI